MNGKTNKPRQRDIPEIYLHELAAEMTKRTMGYSEVIDFIKNRCNKRYEITSLLSALEARGYLVMQERRRVANGIKSFYTIMTKEKYEKIEEEHRENAKRRLLAAVSY